MNPDIVIIRDGGSYRLMHGHLRLANVLRTSDEVFVQVKGEGPVKVSKSLKGYLVSRGDTRSPLLRN